MAETTQQKPPIYLYTDGASSGNPGPGGYGVVLKCGSLEKEMSEGFSLTTNNRMELLAVINGLEALKESCAVTLYSDSKYVIDALTLGWAQKWRANGWMRNKKEAAKNPELWERLLNLCQKHEMTYVWVKGHAENEYNNRCDKMAVAESKKFMM